MTIDIKAIRDVALVTADSERMQFRPSTIIALLDRLEAAKSEVLEQARLLGISAEKELALMAKLEATENAKVGKCCTRCVVFCQGGSGCYAGVPQISAIEKTKLISEQLERTR